MSEERKAVNGSSPISSDTSKDKNTPDTKQDIKKTSRFKKICAKLGLDIGTLLMMFKGSVAPTIAIAFYQADVVCYWWMCSSNWRP